MYGTVGVNVCAVVDIEPMILGPAHQEGNALRMHTRWGTPSVRDDTRRPQHVAFAHCLPCWWSLGQEAANALRARAVAVELSAFTSRSLSPAISLRVGVVGTRYPSRGQSVGASGHGRRGEHGRDEHERV